MKNQIKKGIVLTILTFMMIITIQTSVLAQDFNQKIADKDSVLVQSADITAPVINSITVDKTEVNIDDTVTVTLDVTEASEATIVVYYKQPVTGNQNTKIFNKNNEGQYVGTYTITDAIESGTWEISSIYAADAYNNIAIIQNHVDKDLSGGNFTVSGVYGPDVMAPEFKNITIDKTLAVINDNITITAEATDNLAETISIQVFLRSPITKIIESPIGLSKNENEQYTGVFQIDNLTENGIWKIDHLELKDDSSNTKILYNQNIYQNSGEIYCDFSNCDFSISGTDGEGTIAEIPDSNLLGALNYALGRASTPTAEITQEDLAGLTGDLYLSSSIKSIVGLEYCTGITGIDLGFNNELTDISPISNLTNLRTLKLYGVPVVDTSILSNLTGLTNLEIGSSQINDISFLSGLTNLKELKLADSQVTSLDILSNLSNLESLSLSNNYNLTEINSLSSLPQLSKLELIRNEQLTDLSALLNLSNLTSFKCRYSPFFDINLLTNATNLEEIEINENQLSDISILSNFPQLSVLNLWGNQIADISPLSNLTALTELNLYHNRITNISALENLKNITSLNLQEQQLTLPIIQCIGGSVASDNPVIGLDGLPVEPVVSSEIGEYNKLTNKIEWKNIPEYVKNEQFSFLVDVPIGEYANNFSGTITQPIMGSGTLVEIPDATLKTKLNQALGVSNLDTEITQEQLKSLTGTLNLNYSGNDRIKTIEGLEYCTNITGLMLQAGDVSDLTPLAGLTGLETLDLSMNQISDLSPLKDMIMLKDLNLNFNSISNLETISNFKNLESLQIVVNSVSDLTPLAGLINLKTLFLDHNEVNDLTPLANLINLKSLSFGNTEIRDLSILKNLNSLESLSVSDNNISDISVLKEKTKLRSLTLRNNNISDISSLSSCTALEALYLGNNKISDVSALRDLNSLQHLDLNGNQIKDISSLTGKTELIWLFLGSNQIKDISPILSSDKIEWLTLGPQSLTLPPAKVSYGGAISIENRLIGLDGSVITPGTISAGGTYNVALNNIVWNNVNSNAILTYDFDKDIVIGDSKASFSGIVSQPVEIASDPPSGPSTPSPIPAPNIDDVKAIDEINKAQEGAVVDVPIRNNEPLPVTILETLKGRDINVVFEFENYSWTINGKSITDLPEDIKSYDLSVKTIDDPELGELANGEDVLQIEISHNGEFPFVGQLTYNVDPSLNGKTVYRYYYDEVLKKLVFQDKTIVKDGKVTFYFEHASKYVITDIDQLKDAIIECSYQTHVQNIGWQGFKKNGDLSGTTGQSLRLEGIEIKIHGSENLTVEYKTHVQNIGWQDFVSNGKTSGTTGKSLRLEAIQIMLIGSDAEKYDLYYQVHAQNFGWLDWAKNGESAGTEGFSDRLEAIRILILPKGSEAPGPMTKAFVKNCFLNEDNIK